MQHHKIVYGWPTQGIGAGDKMARVFTLNVSRAVPSEEIKGALKNSFIMTA